MEEGVSMSSTDKIKNIFEKAVNDICSKREQYVKRPADFTRNRKLDFKTMLKTIISMQGQSIDKELFNSQIDATASAFVQARQKLSDNLLETIFHNFKIPVQKKLNGYRLLAFDGSEIQIPYNEKSETFNRGGIKKNGEPRKGDNSFHLNALYDLLNKSYEDAKIIPVSNERGAAYEMIDRYDDNKAIIICDRGYIGYNIIEHFNRNPKTEYIIRSTHGSSMMNPLKFLPFKELDIDIEFTLSTLPEPQCRELGYVKVVGKSPFGKEKKKVNWDFERTCKMKIRVVRILLSTGEYETLITSLPRDKWSADDIKELYRMRWGIETSFRELKYYIGVINFHTKDEAFIKQEIFANLIAYNFCSAIAMTVKIRNFDSEKYLYKIDFSFAFHVIKEYLRDFSKSPPNRIDGIISKHIQPVRKDRTDERKIKPKGVIPFMYRVALKCTVRAFHGKEAKKFCFLLVSILNLTKK